MPKPKLRALASKVTSYSGLASILQRIDDVEVEGLPNAVNIRFGTYWATVPIVEIFRRVTGNPAADMVPANVARVAFPIFNPPSYTHEGRLDGLDQDTRYWFRITAGDIAGRKPAVRTGWFMTGRRIARVYGNRLAVWRDGDPGANGEMIFILAVYDADRTNKLTQVRYPKSGEADIGDGEEKLRPFGVPAANFNAAPERLTLFLTGYDMDCPDIPGPGQGICAVGELFPQERIPVPDHGEDDDHVWADVAETFTLPDTLGLTRIGLTLDSGNWGVRYQLLGAIESEVTAPRQKMRTAGVTDGISSTTLERVGHSITVGGGKMAQMLTLAPNGELYRRVRDRNAPAKSRTEWEILGGAILGSVSVLRRDPKKGVADLFAVGRDGRVRYATIDGDRVEPLRWTDLGGQVVGRVIVLPSKRHGFDLLARSAEGAIFYKAANEESGSVSDWVNLGGRFVDAPAACRTDRGELHVFAIDCEGTAFHRNVAEDEWKRLGGAFIGGVNSTSHGRGGLVVFGLHEDRSVHAKVWDGRAWEPSGEEWEPMGAVDDLEEIEEMPELSHKGGKREAKRARKSHASA